MSETTHTPTPWQFVEYVNSDGTPFSSPEQIAAITGASALNAGGLQLWGISTPDDDRIICYSGNGPTSKANAEHIVRCVNAWDKLVEALEAEDAVEQHHIDCPDCDPRYGDDSLCCVEGQLSAIAYKLRKAALTLTREAKP